MKECRMVSLDTSSTATGYAYWENAVLKESGELKADSKDKEDRLDEMCLKIMDILRKYKPHIVVIEMTVVETNANTQRILSEIVGVVRGYALMHDCDFVRYRPSSWRYLVKDENETLSKKREDLKKWSVAKVSKLYGINGSDNETDAILIGLAHINYFKSF